MSNQLFIEIVESRTAGTSDPFEFSVSVNDGYGAAYDKGYASLEALMEAYPTRLDLLEWVSSQVEFSDAFSCNGSEVLLNSVSGIEFTGYPEDESITEMTRVTSRLRDIASVE